MRAPDFWADPEARLLPRLIQPLAWAYRTGARLRAAVTRPWRAPIPVLCIGNLVTGGAGKTPLALDLGIRLSAGGHKVHFLSRGYRGAEVGPIRVEPENHATRDVGDEALLLAEIAPTWVSRDRRLGCRWAAEEGADIVVMDDGFQNPSVSKDLSLLVVDGAFGFGNGQLLPAGPLREPIAHGLDRADAVVILGEDRRDVAGQIRRLLPRPLPVLAARLRPQPDAGRLKDRAVVAFAGIGRPSKFFATAREVGCRLASTHAFPDHYAFREEHLRRLDSEAKAADALLLTTAKDAVRLPRDWRARVEVLTITVEWEDEAALDSLLQGIHERCAP